MNQQDDNGPIIFFGGVVAVIAIGAVVMKAIAAFFDEMAAAFNSFGNMVSSFFPMLFKILEIASTAAGIILVTVAGIYFSWKYIKMVKRATELQEYVDGQLNIRLDDLRTELSSEWTKKLEDLAQDTTRMERKLDELLKPATAAAPISTAEPVTESNDSTAADVETEHDPEQDEDSTQSPERDPAAACAPIPVSQPY